ncbi:putative capsid protein [Camel associated porprismacovirus 1]|uniref:Putative capsid protein n=1 Tax=Camel associated porprismacovirus 1 TaxID=2170105 RepID=A0A0A1EIN5_9VIRU|nr:putative capsid protein [Camel associated porprismacovirus 1]AIY31252.1 putative capsid protein [Camel associated porprismacovirus 1]
MYPILPLLVILSMPMVFLSILSWRNDMASYRQYRHQSSSNFGRPSSMRFDLDPRTRYELSKVPFIGDAFRYMDQTKYYNDYLASRGMTWNDVKYPALLSGSGAYGVAASGYRVSKNFLKLYR